MREVDKLMTFIQQNLKANKSQYNSFGKYNYRNKEDILNSVKPYLPEGAYINDTDELVLIGNRFYVKSTASLNYCGESISAVGFAREAESKKGMDDSQLTGACSSYSSKYSYSKLFAIDDSKDADHYEQH
jgi:hypothetical protein